MCLCPRGATRHSVLQRVSETAGLMFSPEVISVIRTPPPKISFLFLIPPRKSPNTSTSITLHHRRKKQRAKNNTTTPDQHIRVPAIYILCVSTTHTHTTRSSARLFPSIFLWLIIHIIHNKSFYQRVVVNSHSIQLIEVNCPPSIVVDPF